MKKQIDITKVKAWEEMKSLGFFKIKFTFQGLAYCYGAALRLNEKSLMEHMTIEPFYRYHYSAKQDKNLIRIEWNIVSRWFRDGTQDHRTHSVLSSQLLKTVKSEIEFINLKTQL